MVDIVKYFMRLEIEEFSDHNLILFDIKKK